MGSHLRHTTTSMAPSGKVLTPDQIAAGQCPLCQQLLTDVQKSSGYYNVQNKGRFFQQCTANKHNEASCPGFWWRNDLATQTFIFQPHHCRQPACAGVGGTDLPNRKNNACIWKACLGCCQAAARAAPEAAICKAPNQKLRSGASQPPIAGSTSTSITAPATPIRTKFAQSLSPTYAAKLANSGEDLPTLSGPGSASSNAQKNRFRVEDQHSIQVFYTPKVLSLLTLALFAPIDLNFKDDAPPLRFTVFCPDYPHFLPSKDKAMVSVLDLAATEVFSAFSESLNAWSITSSSQLVKVGRILRLRSVSVTRCPELETDGLARPLKRERYSPDIEPQGSPSSNRHKGLDRTPSSRSIFTEEDTDIFSVPSSPPTSSAPRASRASSIISIHSTEDEDAIHSNSSLWDAPVGPRGTGWPLMYVVDMAAGFREMAKQTSRAVGFPLVFNKLYNSILVNGAQSSDLSRTVILRAHEKVSLLKRSPKSKSTAVARILRHGVTVNWTIAEAAVLLTTADAAVKEWANDQGPVFATQDAGRPSYSPLPDLTESEPEDLSDQDSRPGMHTSDIKRFTLQEPLAVSMGGKNKDEAFIAGSVVNQAYLDSEYGNRVVRTGDLLPDGTYNVVERFISAQIWDDDNGNLVKSGIRYGVYSDQSKELYLEYCGFSLHKRIALSWENGAWIGVLYVEHWDTLTESEQNAFKQLHQLRAAMAPWGEMTPSHPPHSPPQSEHQDPPDDPSDNGNGAEIQGGRPSKRRHRGNRKGEKHGKLSDEQKRGNAEKRKEKKQMAAVQIKAALTKKYSQDQTVMKIHGMEKVTTSTSCALVREFALKVGDIIDDCTNLHDGTKIDQAHIIKFLGRGKSWVTQAEEIAYLMSKYRHSKNPAIISWITGTPEEPSKIGMASFLKQFRRVIRKSGEAEDMEESSGSGSA
ncbi:hypothetical protein DFH09DRAFT_1272300 [Mycena vulgaris]|nr:hypothetical protein DFH09DRAFT_1272300 [Mycena vulgaris]